MRVVLLLAVSALCWGQASPTNPTAPTSVPSGTRPTPTGSVVNVHGGDDLQAKYTAATCGQDLILDDGATFTGNFVFNKQCSGSNWILVEGTGCSGGTVAIPTYVTQSAINSGSVPPWGAPTLTHYATITSTNSSPPIVTTDGSNVPASHNYFGCLEVTSTTSQYYLIGMTNGLAETVVSQLADHVMFDRNYIHGIAASSSVQMLRGILASGSNISIINNYISQIYSSVSDSQAILLAFGPGPNLITNNFLSAPTEIILSGGTGKTPGYSCTVAASPSPTTTSATVNTCVDSASGSVATPTIGTVVMFITSSGSPAYLPTDSTTITGNSAGALTFNVIHAAPLVGAAKALWGITPSDNTITHNFLYKLPSWNPSDPSWDGVAGRASKDCLEDKYGARWNVSGNVCVNSWNAGQNFALNINVTDQNGDCPWCISSDFSLVSNVWKNIAGEVVIIPTQSYTGPCPGYLKRVLIQNNLFFVAGAAPYIASGGAVMELAGYTGCGLSGGGADSVQILHNHLLGAGINLQVSSGIPYNYTNLLIRDNITEFDQYRWTNNCTDATPAFQDGTACMNGDISTSGTWSASNNAIVNSGAINGGQGVSDATILSRYSGLVLTTLYDTSIASGYSLVPFVNYSAVNSDYHNFGLTGAGPWIGTASDGTNPGVNLRTLDVALFGSTSVFSGSIYSGKSLVSGGSLIH